MSSNTGVAVYTAVAKSYRIVAEDICKVNQWACTYYVKPMLPLSAKTLIVVASQYDVAIEYSKLASRRPKAVYITVEGEFANREDWNRIRQLCSNTHCIVPTKWGKALMESHGVPVSAVVYHALPAWSPELRKLRTLQRTYDVVYLNAYYRFRCTNNMMCPTCERKGWRWWPEIYRRFSAIAFSSNYSSTGVVKIDATSIKDIYMLLAVGRVYANLSTHEGFGLNPIMALAVGTNVVTWSYDVAKEVLDGLAVFVDAPNMDKCSLGLEYGLAPGTFIVRYGNIEEFIRAVERALAQNNNINYDEVERRFSPKNYLVFSEFL